MRSSSVSCSSSRKGSDQSKAAALVVLWGLATAVMGVSSVEQLVEAAAQAGLFLHAADGEKRADCIGRGRGSRIMADDETFVRHAEQRLAGEDVAGHAD